MTKWNDLQEAVLEELQLTEQEASQNNYLEKIRRACNKGLLEIANAFYENIKSVTFVVTESGQVETMPSDFINFTTYMDTYLVYVDTSTGEELNILNPTGVYYKGTNQLMFSILGTYTIYYKALFTQITKEFTDNPLSDLTTIAPLSVLNCLPVYIASNLLSKDDPQESMVLRNEFEILATRLDNDILYNNKSFSEGWDR